MSAPELHFLHFTPDATVKSMTTERISTTYPPSSNQSLPFKRPDSTNMTSSSSTTRSGSSSTGGRAAAASTRSNGRSSSNTTSIPHKLPFALSFFFFGLLNNVLYVVILSAALDLVDKATTPKGLILFVNIAPALMVKIGWPYFVRGEARYSRRISSCSAISFFGIIIVATSSTLYLRLAGIAVASFSSGLGEMTYLQLTTVYGSLELPSSVDLGGYAVGWFSSGTGAAGLVGAGLWWGLRGLGVRIGLLLCSFLPLCMALTYYSLLPRIEAFTLTPFDAYTFVIDDDSASEEENEVEDEDGLAEASLMDPSRGSTYRSKRPSDEKMSLTTREKLALARPLIRRYMLPLFFVYLAEYTINSGVAPTLVYEAPKPNEAPLLSLIIKSLRDYYPLWQLVYQFWVFISRSSLSILKLPPIPLRLLPLPTVFQVILLIITSLESAKGIFSSGTLGENGTIVMVFFLVSCEGLAGGSAYVNCFYRLGKEEDGDGNEEDSGLYGHLETAGRSSSSRVVKSKERKMQEKEFKIASVGFADTLGILLASLVATGLEPWLVKQQVARGRKLCLEL